MHKKKFKKPQTPSTKSQNKVLHKVLHKTQPKSQSQTQARTLKCQLHLHVAGDQQDNIKYSATQAIDKAHECKVDVLSITCHDTLIFNKKLQNYALKKGIILIPGIEKTIDSAHILIYNCNKEVLQVDSFAKLKAYKKAHPEILVMAAHPFHPSKHSLMFKFFIHKNLLDCIEFCHFYSFICNPNLLSKLCSKIYKKPLVATSDIHYLGAFDYAYCLINSRPEKTAILKSLKTQTAANVTTKFSTLALIKLLYKLNKAVA